MENAIEILDNKAIARAHTDEAWKEALRKYFKSFMELCWPKAFMNINWEKDHEFLEQELSAIHDYDDGKRSIDALIKVWRKDGKETWLIVHIDVQAQWEATFAKRMYIYNYRIFDKYQKDVATLAILIDSNKYWKPNIYEMNVWDFSLKMEYPILKLTDYRDKKDWLEESSNPFAIIMLAQLEALETVKNKKDWVLRKFNLIKRLYEKGLSRDEILGFYRFFEGIMPLPKNLALQYHTKVKEMEGEFKMAYLTTAEWVGLEAGLQKGLQKGRQEGLKQGLEQGIAQGVLEGERNILKTQLEYKFKILSDKYLNQIHQADKETLLVWGRKMLDAKELKEVFEG